MARQTIGEFLQTLRKANGYTQQEIADQLGISNRTLSAWETDRAYPDILTLPELAAIYGVTVDEILKGERSERTENALPTEISSKQERIMLKRKMANYTSYSYILLGVFCASCILLCVSAILAWINWISEIVLFAIGVIGLLLSLLLKIPISLNATLYGEDEETEEQKKYLYRLRRANVKIFSIQAIVSYVIAALFWILIILSLGNSGIPEYFLFAIISTALALFMTVYIYLTNKKTVLHFGTEAQILQDRQNRKHFRKCMFSSAAVSLVWVIIGICLISYQFSGYQVILQGTREEVVASLHTIEVTEESPAHELYSVPIGTYVLDLSSFYEANEEKTVTFENGFVCVGDQAEIKVFFRLQNGKEIGICNAKCIYDEEGKTAAYQLKTNLSPAYGGMIHIDTPTVETIFFTAFDLAPTIRTVDGETQFGIERAYRAEGFGRCITIVGPLATFAIGIAVYFAKRKKIVIYN